MEVEVVSWTSSSEAVEVALPRGNGPARLLRVDILHQELHPHATCPSPQLQSGAASDHRFLSAVSLLGTSDCILSNKAIFHLPRDSSDGADCHLPTDGHRSNINMVS